MWHDIDHKFWRQVNPGKTKCHVRGSQEKCLVKSALVLLGEDVKVAYSCGGLISVKECENGRT